VGREWGAGVGGSGATSTLSSSSSYTNPSESAGEPN
jgi:hypothetical protein